MIEPLVAMRCDGCRVHVGSESEESTSDGLAFDNAEKAWEAARDEGWSTDGLKHFCPFCWADKRKAADSAARTVKAGEQ